MRLARALAVVAWLATIGLAVLEVWMIARTLDHPPPQWGIRGYEAALGPLFASVGALIAVRRPENRIGRATVFAGFLIGLQGVLVQYPALADTVVPPLPGAFLARWFATWMWTIPIASFLMLFPLTFPDGHLLSPRWRPVALFALVATVFGIGWIILNTEPFGPAPASNDPVTYFAAIGARGLIGYIPLWLASLASVASMVQRYRGAGTEVRQQIKWVVYAIVLVGLGALVGMGPFALGQVFFLASAFVAAAAIAIAILRYRLYEIDLIINRTLVYGTLTAILAGVYTASITLSTRLFSSVTGERSDAAIVLTTLIVVSLVTPLKTRLQSIVDQQIRAQESFEALAMGSSLDALDALGRLIRLNASGGLTTEEFSTKKAELLRRV